MIPVEKRIILIVYTTWMNCVKKKQKQKQYLLDVDLCVDLHIFWLLLNEYAPDFIFSFTFRYIVTKSRLFWFYLYIF